MPVTLVKARATKRNETRSWPPRSWPSSREDEPVEPSLKSTVYAAQCVTGIHSSTEIRVTVAGLRENFLKEETHP